MKVLITGGTSGFGKLLTEYFKPNSEAVGRTNDWNLQDETHQIRIAEKSLEFDVFINYAYLDGNTQLNILTSVFDVWEKANKKGLIVNFGTINTYYKRNNYDKYSVQKSAIDEAVRQMAKMSISGEVPFRITNLRLGFLDMEKNQGKNHYPGFGVTHEQIGEVIHLLFKHKSLTYPEIVLDSFKGQ